MNKLLRATLLLLAILVSLGACKDKDESAASSEAGTRAVLISTATAKVTDLPIWLTTVGIVHSKSTPTLAAEVEGRITLVAVDTGDTIEQGQLLAETDTSTLLLQQQAAQAGIDRLVVNISTGERRVARFETLTSKNMSSQTQLDDATELLETYRADYKAAEAQLAIVNDSLAKSRIIAPVSGVIQQRMIAAGDFVKRGDSLFEITRPNLLQARLPVPEALALQIKIGQPAKIYSPLTPGEFVSGEITDLQPSVGLGSRAVMAIIDLDNPGNLRPRATLSGRILVDTRQAAVMVPNVSLVRRPAGNTVYVIGNGIAAARLVETGVSIDGLVEIISGIEGNETIATDGAAFLTDGVAVKVAEPVN